MTKKIKIVENKIDWLEIINLAFNRKRWGEKYVMFISSDIQIVTQMTSFNFINNIAEFKTKILCKINEEEYDESSWNNNIYTNYYMNNYSIQDFIRLVYRNILSKINELKEKTLRNEANIKFEGLYFETIDVEDYVEQFDYEDDYETILSISNDDIKKAVLEDMEEKIIDKLNEEFNNKVNDYVLNTLIKHDGIDEIEKRINKELENEN